MTTGPTASEIKAREHAAWTTASAGWKKNYERIRSSMGNVTERILDAADVGPGKRVLDIACGTGEPAIPAAARVGATGHVIATDFAEPMVAFAREVAAGRGLTNIDLRVVDGELVDVPEGSMDVVTCRWGLMFMPEPEQCLERAYAALRSGGRIALTCWAQPERNLWASLPVVVMKRHTDIPTPPPGAPGMFAFADGARLTSVVASVGFRDVKLEEVPTSTGGFEGPKAFLDFLLEMAGPLARVYGSLDPPLQAAVRADLLAEIGRFEGSGGVEIPGVTWLVSATK